MPDVEQIDATRDRVWAVDVTASYTGYVVAKTAEQAERIAWDKAEDLEPNYVARELTESLAPHHLDSEAIPHGRSRCGDRELTVNEAIELVAAHKPAYDHQTVLMPFAEGPPPLYPRRIEDYLGGREVRAVSDLDLRNVRAIVTDAEVLGRLEPAAVAAYLRRAGWFVAHERAGGAVWSRWLGDHAAKLLVPNDPTFADYAIRMSEVLAALALTEDRSQLAVLDDLYAAAGRREDGPAPAEVEQ